MFFQAFVVILLISPRLIGSNQIFYRIKLTDVPVLQLYRDTYTVGQKPIQQLNCIGNNYLCHYYSPNFVQCVNQEYKKGVKWNCFANISTNVKFGNLSISCEGYNYPSDPYIIAGSCSLRYSLKYIY